METCIMCGQKYEGNECPCGFVSGGYQTESSVELVESETELLNDLSGFDYMPAHHGEHF